MSAAYEGRQRDALRRVVTCCDVASGGKVVWRDRVAYRGELAGALIADLVVVEMQVGQASVAPQRVNKKLSALRGDVVETNLEGTKTTMGLEVWWGGEVEVW